MITLENFFKVSFVMGSWQNWDVFEEAWVGCYLPLLALIAGGLRES